MALFACLHSSSSTPALPFALQSSASRRRDKHTHLSQSPQAYAVPTPPTYWARFCPQLMPFTDRPPSPLTDQINRPAKIAKMSDSLDVADAAAVTKDAPSQVGFLLTLLCVLADPRSYRPDAKTRRYDRQLRLWASAGQKSLESARVLLVGSDAPGTQTLKNLVLPGISHFTVLSPLLTTPQDVATNFFLHPDSIGSSAAESVVKYLKELNPAVNGAARTEDPGRVFALDPAFFTSFSLIVTSNVDPKVERQIADLLWKTSLSTGGPDIPLVSVRSSGFIGQIQVQVREHCVVDTHPETTHTLRLDHPFPALEQYARDLDLDALDSMEHSHVPYVILLVKAAAQWKDKHDGKLPTYDDRDEFKAFINSGRRKGDEENYDEAVGQAFNVYNKSETPYNLQQLLESKSVKNVSQASKNLHILLHALGQYLATHLLPPLSPTLPDMHASTTRYIALQNLYKQQYCSDLAEYRTVLTTVLESLGLPADAVPDDEVESFVRNSAGTAIILGSALSEGRVLGERLKEAIDEHLLDEFSENQLAVAAHLAFLASEQYSIDHGRWPGQSPQDDVEAQQSELEGTIYALTGKAQGSLPDVVGEAVAEITRGGFGQLPTTAAFIGGLVAQESIKLVTKQYVPLDNTVIVDLVKSTTKALQL